MLKQLLFISTFILFPGSLLFLPAQQAVSVKGVPGACGYPGTNHSVTRSGNPLSPQDGSGTLGNTYNFTKCGLNYIAVSNRLGQRFSPAGVPQPAPYIVSGLNPCDSIEKAFLWVEGSGTGAAQTITIQPPSGPSQNFPMTLIGTGPDKCWGYASTVTYRADVTSVINGNGTYNLSNVFTNPPTAGEDMDGATLIIIYSDHTASYQGTLVIDDGCIEVTGGTANYDMNYSPACGPTTNAQAFCAIGDIQMPVNSLTLNGTPTPITWDWYNYVSTSTTISTNQATSNFNVVSTGDCYNLCMVGVYFQSTTCAVCPVNSATLSVSAVSTLSACPGCTGTATANPTPAGVYSYSWNPGGQTTQTATNLCAGVYTVTVSGGCLTQTTTVTVGNVGNLTASTSHTNESCFNGTTGTATANPAGGTFPYTYSWAPTGGNNATATGLAAGTYTCTVSDANGCIYLTTATITEPPGMTIDMTVTNVSCNGQNDGHGSAIVSGGAPTYTYAWTPTGGNNATSGPLAPGNYTFTVTDANGCPLSQPITITQPAPLSNTMTTMDVGCFSTGSATATPSGGTGPYTYFWSNGGNSATDINLTVGTYIVLITDSNGCTLTDTAQIFSTSGITTTSSFSNITCFGANNGSATVVSSGGNPPFNYSWSPTGGNNATASNLGPGQYTCTITDQNGCTSTATFTFTQPPQLTTVSASTNVSCGGGADGSGTIAQSGGTGPYTYAWSPSGGTGQTATGLSAGNYTVTVTDSHGCTSTQSITVTQPPVLLVTSQNDSVCAGQPATISSSTSGGIPPYTYSWSNGSNAPSQTVNVSANTTFTLTVTDANNCSSTSTALVTVDPLPNAAFTSNATNGVFTLTGLSSQLCFTGPTTGISTWLWDLNGTGTANTSSVCVPVTATDVGTYCATLAVVSSQGCLDTSEVCLEINNVYYSIPNVFTPNADGNNDAFVITNLGMKSLHCEIYDRWGALVYEWEGTGGYWNGKSKNGGDAVDGVYYYTVHMEDFAEKQYEESGFVHLIIGK